ncbi:MAG TPA: molybdopterin-guanine dinucleotide biosynthesis protein B, partial [Methylomicrobium sp.]|nr:molybdopterin-guanine dinucleotide biosynthesis protein B [Methylomicrobium sp.]
MQNAQKPILGFAAPSGTGKTTLLTQLIPLLKQQGLRVGLIKHSHHSFDIDHPGKDSHRLRMAGASPVMLVSRYRYAIMHEFEVPQE